MYAQTYLQLFNQLRRDGYSGPDRDLVRDAYEIAMVLFAGRFQASGKSFIAHVVGTAGILASQRLPASVVAAGLLHNVYDNGDFRSSRRGVSAKKRRELERLLGPDVEKLVATFPVLDWKSATIELALADPDELTVVDRHVVLLRLADYLEHLADLDVLYYGDRARRYYLGVGDAAIALARNLGLSELAREIEDALRLTQEAELPDLSMQELRDSSFVVTPGSCRKRYDVAAWENVHRVGEYLCRSRQRV
jgi:(p)ppGpp synthase/HD superfamily hydrolase